MFEDGECIDSSIKARVSDFLQFIGLTAAKPPTASEMAAIAVMSDDEVKALPKDKLEHHLHSLGFDCSNYKTKEDTGKCFEEKTLPTLPLRHSAFSDVLKMWYTKSYKNTYMSRVLENEKKVIPKLNAFIACNAPLGPRFIRLVLL